MKNLVLSIVSVAAVSVYAYPEISESSAPLEPGVYSITLTQKGLAYAMTSKSVAQPTPKDTEEFLALPETEADAVAEAETYFYHVIQQSYNEELQALVSVQTITTKKVTKLISGTAEYRYVFTIKYNAPRVNARTGVASTKVASTTVNGLYVSGYGKEMDGAYIWNSKLTDTYTNTFAKADTAKSYTETYEVESEAAERIVELTDQIGAEVGDVLEGSIEKKNSGKKFKVSYKIITKKNPIKLAMGSKQEDFEIRADADSVTGNGKSSAGFNWGSMAGWGTGTAQKDDEGVYATIKTVAGNTVDQEMRSFGTWKFQADAAATKLAEKGQTIEQILATKKVELVK